MTLYELCPWCRNRDHASVVLVCMYRHSGDVSYAAQGCRGCAPHRALKLQDENFELHVMSRDEYALWEGLQEVMES